MTAVVGRAGEVGAEVAAEEAARAHLPWAAASRHGGGWLDALTNAAAGTP
jgi:hypothetical protein